MFCTLTALCRLFLELFLHVHALGPSGHTSTCEQYGCVSASGSSPSSCRAADLRARIHPGASSVPCTQRSHRCPRPRWGSSECTPVRGVPPLGHLLAVPSESSAYFQKISKLTCYLAISTPANLSLVLSTIRHSTRRPSAKGCPDGRTTVGFHSNCAAATGWLCSLRRSLSHSVGFCELIM